jgi:hypothetical protein
MYQLRESVSRSVFEPEPSGTLSLPPKTILFLIYVFRVFDEKYRTAAPVQSPSHQRRYAVVHFILEIHKVRKINK